MELKKVKLHIHVNSLDHHIDLDEELFDNAVELVEMPIYNKLSDIWFTINQIDADRYINNKGE